MVHLAKFTPLRIISGIYKGRRLNPPSSLPVRPTTDFAREGLFNVLNGMVDWEQIKALDLFSGTGAVSFELISRGVPSVTSVDIERSCVTYITGTAGQFGMKGIQAIRSNVFVFIRRIHEKYDLIFADPPYAMQGIADLPEQVLSSGILKEGGIFVLEHSDKYNFSKNQNFAELRKYGRVHFTFFRGSAGKETN